MEKLVSARSLSTGLAMFSMFFGAGNIIFPLAVGQFAGDKNLFAILGLILTAAIIPIEGVIAMILFDGNYKQFFGRLGNVPGFILALTIITLLGPLGSTPRCIALSYTTLKGVLAISPIAFSAISCGIIFLFSVRKNYILSLLGWVLTPALLFSLIAIIAIGLTTSPDVNDVDRTKWNIFLYGLKEGYNTMDLLAAFFFSSTILNILRMREHKTEMIDRQYLRTAFQASLIGAFLLASIYLGFSYIAAFHGGDLNFSGKDELLAAITMKIAGPAAGTLVCITIALACLTTAIALISAFADFFQKEVMKEKISYELTLIFSLLLTFFVSTFEFSGISAFLGPILQICYPGLIVLTLLNIFHRMKNIQPIKTPVFLVFGLSAIWYFVH